MRILLLEPFMGESHAAWAKGFAQHSQHQIEIWGLPGRHWKWRMHGAAETFAARMNEMEVLPDLILATDMLDLAGFLALTRKRTAQIPVALYFHENQLAYPWSPNDPDKKLKRDNHYAYINYRSALVADAVLFSSPYNQNSFLDALPTFLKAFPDHQEVKNVARIRAKSSLLSLGLELKTLDEFRPAEEVKNDVPLVVWNHRWEYDKCPDQFFKALIELKEENVPFELAVLGRSYQKSPAIFAEAKEMLADRIVHWGFAESFEAYAKWLWRADILPVTSQQEFFGGSVVEAMYCNCLPLLPNALAYPDHIPQAYRSSILHNSENEFKEKLKAALLNELQLDGNPREWVQKYDWQSMIRQYDQLFESLI